MPPWVEAKIKSGILDRATDWQACALTLSDEFRSLMPGVSRAVDSGVAYTALFPATGTPNDEWYLPARRSCRFFIQTSDGVDHWFLHDPPDEVVSEASRSLALFVRELGAITFEDAGCLGRGRRLDNDSTDCWIDTYLEVREEYFEDMPTKEGDLFPCRDALFVADCGEGDAFVEYQKRIYSLSPVSDDMRFKDLGAGPGVRFKDSMGAYSSEVIQTFADLADRIIARELGLQ